MSDAAVDRMIADAEETGISLLDGPDGLVNQLTARIIERALAAEMNDHLGYGKGDPAGRGSGNSRNGHSVSPALISNITDVVADEIVTWQTRPLGAFYAIIYIDSLVVKVRDGGMVANKAAYLAAGVDADGFNVPGIWLGGGEGPAFWAGVLAEPGSRGVKDVLFVCCDGLKGIPEAVKAAWKDATVQTCVIHLIRSPMKYVSWKDRKKAAALMRPVYTTVNEAAAKAALENMRREYGKKAPGMIAAWERAWDEFIPFLRFDAAIRTRDR